MLSTEQLNAYFICNRLSPAAQKIITRIRQENPSRRVGGGTHNVTCRFASIKMGQVIQAESHKGELAAVYLWEHDSKTHEFYDQPPQVKMSYYNAAGRHVTHMATPDYFVLSEDWAGWVECKPEEKLQEILASGSELFALGENGKWRSPPGEAFAAQFGMAYRVISSKEHNFLLVRNLEFLTDYLDERCPIPASEAREAVEAAFADERWLVLGDLLRCDGITPDAIYAMIARGQLFVDLENELLAEPAFTRVCRDKFSSEIYHAQKQGAEAYAPVPLNAIEVVAGTRILWDGKPWRILNVGAKEIFLDDDSKTITHLTPDQFKTMITGGAITGLINVVDDRQAAADEVLRRASLQDLDQATKRQRAIAAAEDGIEDFQGAPVPARTLRYWKKLAREGEIRFGNAYVGLIGRTCQRGNRERKIETRAIELMEAVIRREVLTNRKKVITKCYGALLLACKENAVTPPSEKTFRAEIKRRREEEIILAREGRRAAYAVSEFVWRIDQSTPRHGERPFEVGHIDHTQADTELADSRTGVNLGRPWLTVLIDAFTRMVIATYVTFDPPSYRSCMMVIRNAVMRHHRIPKTIVVDQGSDFESAYFERLLAAMGSHKKTRPAAKSRFGSVVERFFGVSNQDFFHNLLGNTQASNNPRRMSPSHNPKTLAVWTLPALTAAFEEYAYERYADMPHSTLGMPPRSAMARGLAMAGERAHMLIPYTEGFRLLCLPTTPSGKATVRPGKGVKVLGSYYWHAAFRDPRIAGQRVAIRYDPFDMSRAYAYVGNAWQLCRSEYQAIFERRSEREIATISAEVRALNRQANSTASRRLRAALIAAYLCTLHDQETVLLQQRRDAEKLAANGEAPPDTPPARPSIERPDNLWTSSIAMNTYEELK